MPPKKSLTWPVNKNFGRGQLKKNGIIENEADGSNPFKKFNNKEPNIADTISILNYNDLMFVDLNDFHYINDRYTIEINVSFPHAIDFSKARNICTFGYHIKGENSGEITIGTDPTLGDSKNNIPVLGVIGKYPENTKKATPLDNAVAIISGTNTTYNFKIIYNPFEVNKFLKLSLFVNDTLNSTSEGIVNLYNFSTANRKLLLATSGYTNEPTWEGKMDLCPLEFINANFSSREMNYPSEFLSSRTDNIPSEIQAEYENASYYNNSLYISKNARSGIKYSFKSNYPSSNKKVIVYDEVNNASFVCSYTQTIGDTHYCAGIISEGFNVFSKATIVIDDLTYDTTIFPLTINGVPPIVDNKKPTDVRVKFINADDAVFKVKFEHVVDDAITSGISIPQNTYKNITLLENGQTNGALPSGNGVSRGIPYKLTVFLVESDTYDPETFDLSTHPENLIIVRDIQDNLDIISFTNVTNLYTSYRSFAFVTDHMNNESDYFIVYGTESGISLLDIDAPEIKITNITISGNGDKPKLSIDGYAFDERSTYDVYGLVTSIDHIYDLTEDKDKNKLQTVLFDNSNITHVLQSLSNTSSNLGVFSLNGESAFSQFYNGYFFSDIEVDKSYHVYLMNKDSSEHSENTFVQYLNNLTIPRNIITITQIVDSISVLSLNPNFDFTDLSDIQVAIPGDNIAFSWKTKFYEEIGTPYELTVDGISYSNYTVDNDVGTEFSINVPIYDSTSAGELSYSLYRKGMRLSPQSVSGKVFVQHSLDFIETDWVIETQPDDPNNFHNNVIVKGLTNTLMNNLIPQSLLQENIGINQDIRLGYPFSLDLTTNSGIEEYLSTQADSIGSYDFGSFTQGDYNIPDLSSNNRDLLVYGNPNVDSSTKSIILDGNNDYLKYTNIGNTAGAWSHSIAFWIYVDSQILNQSSGYQETVFFIGQLDTLKSIAFKYITIDSQTAKLDYSFWYHNTEMELGSEYFDRWQHIVLTYDGQTNFKKVYHNGVLSTTTLYTFSAYGTDESSALNLDINQPIEIGRDPRNMRYFKGKVRQFQMFSRVLTPREAYIASMYPVDGLNNAILDVPMNFSVVYNKDNQTFTPTLNTIIYENLEEHSYLDMTIKITSKAGLTKSVTKSFYTGFDSPILSISNTYMSTNNAVRIFSNVSAFDKTSTLTVYYAVFLQQYTKDELKTFFVDNERGDILLYKGENNTNHSLSISEFTKYYQTIDNSTPSDMNIYNTTYYLHVYLVDDRNFDAFAVSNAMTINILANNFGIKTTTTNNTRNIYMLKHGDSVTLSWQTSYVSNASDFTATVFGLPVTPTSTNGVNWRITKALPSNWTTNRSLSDPQFFSVSYFTTPIPFPNLICINITIPEMNITLANVSRTGNTSSSSTSITFINLDTLKTSENPKGNDYSNYRFEFTATQVSTNEIKQTIINNSYPTTNAVINGLTGGNIYDIQVKVTDAAGNQYSSTVFSLQTKIPDNSSPTADLTVKTPKDPPILGYNINGYIWFTAGEIDAYAFMSDSATGYTDAQYTSLFTLYPSLKLTNYNSLNAFSNKTPTASAFDSSNLSFTKYYDGSTFRDFLTERQYYLHVVAEILNIGTTQVQGIENDWFPTVHYVPKIPQTITVSSFTTTNTYNNKVGTHGDTINLLFNTAYPEIKNRISYNLGVPDSYNVRLFNVNDDNMTWKITYDIESSVPLKEADETITTEIVTQASATVTFSGPDAPVLLDITNGLTNVVFNLGANTNYLYETDQTSILSNSVNKSVGSLVKSLFVLKEWNGLSTDTEHNNFTITVDEQCEIMIGTGFNDEARLNQAKSILKLFFNVTDADIVKHSGYGFMRESTGTMHGPATWFGCAVSPGTYSSPAGQFGDNWDWMMMGISHATATIVTETQQDGTYVEIVKDATGNVINTTTKTYKYIDPATGDEVYIRLNVDVNDNLRNVYIPSLQTMSLYFEPDNTSSITTSTAINFPLTPFAISLWVKFDTTNPTDVATYLGAPSFLMPYAIDDTGDLITLRGHTTTDQTYYGDVFNSYDQTISKDEWHHICRTYIPPTNQGHGFDNMTHAWRQTYYVDGVQIYDVSYPPDRILGSEAYDENYVAGTNLERKRISSDSWTFDLYWNYTAELSRSSDDSVFHRMFSHSQISNMAVWLNTNITKNTVQMLFEAGPGYIPIPLTITADEFKYTFEISVLSADASNWIVPMHILADNIALFENSNFVRLEMLVYPQSAFPEDEDIIHLTDSDPNTYVNWRDNPQPVGTKLFNLYFTERVNNITIQHQRPSFTPGWKIYENDVVVYTDTLNHGDSLDPVPYPVTYFFNKKSIYDSASHYYPFGDNKLIDVNGGNNLVFFNMNSTRDNFDLITNASIPSGVSFQLNQPLMTIPEILDPDDNVIYSNISIDENGNVISSSEIVSISISVRDVDWSQETLNTPDANLSITSGANGNYGLSCSLSADGKTAVVGGWPGGNVSGGAWIWTENTSGAWSKTANLSILSFDALGNYGMASSMSADGNTVLVTGGDTFSSGGAWIWEKNEDGTWGIVDPTSSTGYRPNHNLSKLSDANGEYAMSCALSADGKTALLCGRDHNTDLGGGSKVGGGWIWERNSDGTWGVIDPTSEIGFRPNHNLSKLTNTNGEYGRSCALSGNGKIALIAGMASSSSGGAWIWEKSSDGTHYGVADTSTSIGFSPNHDLSKLSGTNGVYGEGCSLSIDGKTALISGNKNSYSGGAWVWKKDDTSGTWSIDGDLSKLSGANGYYGQSCSLTGDGKVALVAGGLNINAGGAWLWKKDDITGTWSQIANLSKTSSALGNYGRSCKISYDGTTALIAGQYNSTRGCAWIWKGIDNGESSVVTVTESVAFKVGLLTDYSTTYSELSGGYSVKRLYSEYSGPQLRIMRSTDNAEQDFTFDKDGLSSEYESWIGSSTAYVTKWYDQSGNKNHGTIGTNKSVKLDYANKTLVFSRKGYFNLPDGTVPFNNDPYTLIAYHGTNANINGSLISSGTDVDNQANILMRWGDSEGYANNWWNNDIISGVYRTDQVVVARYNGTTRNLYNPIDGNGSEEVVTVPRSSTAVGNAIGRPIVSTTGAINWEGVVSNQPDADLSLVNIDTNGRYGWCSALSADGNTALISGYDYSGGGLHVWTRNTTSGVWTMTADLSLTITTQGTYGYGCALSADGKMAVVNGSYSYSYKYVYVWEKNEDGTWGVPDSSQTSGFIYNFYRIRSGDNIAGGSSGLSISYNKRVIVEAGSIGNNSGMIYVWEKDDNNVWGVPSSTTEGGYLPNHKISIENANGYGGYGMRCVAVSEDATLICVGCHGASYGLGGAFIWEKGADGTYGVPDETNSTGIGPNYNLSKLTDADGQYGTSVAMSLDGSTILTISRSGWIWKRTPDGTAYGVVDPNSATGYSPNVRIERPYDALGFTSDIAMSHDGKTILFTGAKNSESGGGYIYMENEDGTWSVRANLSMVSGANGYYGRSCAMSADASVVLIAGYSTDNISGGAWIWNADFGPVPGLSVSVRKVDWTQEVSNAPVAELARLDGTAIGQYGSWSALSGDGKTAVIASFKGTNGGGLFVWTQDENGIWTMTDDLSYLGGWNNKGSYGIACGVSWDGELIAVSGTYINSQTKWLFVWEKNPDGIWGLSDTTQPGGVSQPSGRVASNFRIRSGWNSHEYNGGSVSLAVSANKRIIADGGNYGSYRGYVYIWEKVGGVWGTPVPGVYMGFDPTYILSMDTSANGYYGDSVALSGDGSVVCVGARGTTNTKGGAWVWERNADGTYGVPDANASCGFAPNHNLSKLEDTDGYYGTSVDISFDGQTILVTATNPGAGWIWKRNEEGTAYGIVDSASTTGFAPNQKITKPNGAIGDFGKFGHLSADGKLALISGPNDFESGGAFLFTENNDGSWYVIADLSKTSGANGRYAHSSALSGDGTTALFAGYQSDNLSGSAWIWKGTDLGESDVLTNPDLEPNGGASDGNSTSQYWEGDMHSILIYKNALNYTDISGISDTLLINVTTEEEPYTEPEPGLLRDYSTTTYSELNGGYSIKKLYDEYSGPHVRIKRSTDNAEQDFSFDKDGNSTEYETWIGSATAYVTKWYDQSGNNNHGTVVNTVSFDYANKRLTFGATGYFNLPNGTVPYNNDPYTFVCYHGSNTNNIGVLIGSGSNSNHKANTFRRDVDSYHHYWWYNDITAGTYRADQVIVSRFNGTTRNVYSPSTDGNGSEVAYTTPRSSTNLNNSIGNFIHTSEYWIGDMYTILIYKSALDYADISGISNTLHPVNILNRYEFSDQVDFGDLTASSTSYGSGGITIGGKTYNTISVGRVQTDTNGKNYLEMNYGQLDLPQFISSDTLMSHTFYIVCRAQNTSGQIFRVLWDKTSDAFNLEINYNPNRTGMYPLAFENGDWVISTTFNPQDSYIIFAARFQYVSYKTYKADIRFAAKPETSYITAGSTTERTVTSPFTFGTKTSFGSGSLNTMNYKLYEFGVINSYLDQTSFGELIEHLKTKYYGA